jgi:hypothetical protein
LAEDGPLYKSSTGLAVRTDENLQRYRGKQVIEYGKDHSTEYWDKE